MKPIMLQNLPAIIFFVNLTSFFYFGACQNQLDQYKSFGTFGNVIGCTASTKSEPSDLTACCAQVCDWTLQRFPNETRQSKIKANVTDIIRYASYDKICVVKKKDMYNYFQVAFRCWEISYEPRDCGIACYYGKDHLGNIFISEPRAKYNESRINFGQRLNPCWRRALAVAFLITLIHKLSWNLQKPMYFG